MRLANFNKTTIAHIFYFVKLIFLRTRKIINAHTVFLKNLLARARTRDVYAKHTPAHARTRPRRRTRAHARDPHTGAHARDKRVLSPRPVQVTLHAIIRFVATA